MEERLEWLISRAVTIQWLVIYILIGISYVLLLYFSRRKGAENIKEAVVIVRRIIPVILIYSLIARAILVILFLLV